MNEAEKMIMKLWCEVYTTCVRIDNTLFAKDAANKAVRDFYEKFPVYNK